MQRQDRQNKGDTWDEQLTGTRGFCQGREGKGTAESRELHRWRWCRCLCKITSCSPARFCSQIPEAQVEIALILHDKSHRSLLSASPGLSSKWRETPHSSRAHPGILLSPTPRELSSLLYSCPHELSVLEEELCEEEPGQSKAKRCLLPCTGSSHQQRGSGTPLPQG